MCVFSVCVYRGIVVESSRYTVYRSIYVFFCTLGQGGVRMSLFLCQAVLPSTAALGPSRQAFQCIGCYLYYVGPTGRKVYFRSVVNHKRGTIRAESRRPFITHFVFAAEDFYYYCISSHDPVLFSVFDGDVHGFRISDEPRNSSEVSFASDQML